MNQQLPPDVRPAGLIIDSQPTPALDATGKRVSDVWDENYRKYGRMWGTDPSQTVRILMGELQKAKGEVTRRMVVADLGCGYGRDTIRLASAGYIAKGVDVAMEGLELAQQDYERAQEGPEGVSFVGHAEFIKGNIESAFRGQVHGIGGLLDAISSHRALHLMPREQMVDFAETANNLLRSKGLIAIGGRSLDGFDRETMHWLPGAEGVTAEYNNRPGHVLNFLSEKLLKEVFESHFNILKFTYGSELERKGSDDKTHQTPLIFMLAQKRNGDSSHHYDGPK